MNEKLSFQNIVDSLSQKSDVSKKVSETFTKAFFDTIVEALYMGEESIKIKGLGIFKLVAVEDRESINVTNGERIVIAGYKKVAFTPDDAIVERLNASANEEESAEEEEDVNAAAAAAGVAENVEQAPVTDEEEKAETAAEDEKAEAERDDEKVTEGAAEEAEAVVEEAEGDSEADEEEDVTAEEEKEEIVAEEKIQAVADIPNAEAEAPASRIEASLMNADIDELVKVPEPKRVEVPVNPLSGIDMLISTPESLDEVREQYLDAKEKFDKAVEAAREANMEKTRLEILLSHLEANAEPESAVEDEQQENEEHAVELDAVAESVADEKIVERMEMAAVIGTEGDDSADTQTDGEDDAPATDAAEAEVSGELAAAVIPPTDKDDNDTDDDASAEADAVNTNTLEQPVVTESAGQSVAADAQDAVRSDVAESAGQPSAKDGNEALERLLTDKREATENKEKMPKDHTTLWIVSIFGVILLGIIAFFLYKTSASIESVEKVADVGQKKEMPAKPEKTKPVVADSLEAKKAAEKDSVNLSVGNADGNADDKNSEAAKAGDKKDDKKTDKQGDDKAKKNDKPKTYQIKKGDSLTRISQRFYNTKDSVSAIIRANKFKDPNNVPIGAVINLP